MTTHLKNVQGLVNGSLCIKRESRIYFCGNLSWDNLQDLLSELNQETVQSSVDLVIEILAVLFAVCDGGVDEFGVFGLLGCGEDKGRIGGSVLWFVCGDCCDLFRIFFVPRRFGIHWNGVRVDTYMQNHL